MRKKLLCTLVGTLLATGVAGQGVAGELSLNLYGMSYHFKKGEAYKNAPRSLFGSEGQYVGNPGLGIEYDFREKGSSGFSPFITAGFFRDCADYPFYFLGGGVRYRHDLFSSKFFWDISIGGAIANAEDWEVVERNGEEKAIGYGRETTFLPVAGLGVGMRFNDGKNYIKYSLTYVPENNDIGGTSGTSLLFMWITIGF